MKLGFKQATSFDKNSRVSTASTWRILIVLDNSPSAFLMISERYHSGAVYHDLRT